MKKSIVFLVLILTLSLLAGCGSDLPAIYVQSVADITGYVSLGQVTTCSGLVVAGDETDVEKDDGRTVSEICVKVGQQVAEGDVLFIYDTEEIKLSLDKAELEIEQLKNSVTDLSEQIAQLEKEKANAASSEQLSYTVQIQTLQADKRETEYNITVKERELETLKKTDVTGEVRSPVSGEIKTVNENGGYDDYTGQALPFITIVEQGAYRVKGKINELNRDQFYVGMEVILRSRVDETQTWSGMIESVDTNPEESNNNYYTYYDDSSDNSSSSYPFYVALYDSEGLILGQHVYIEPYGANEDEAETGLWLDASYVVEEDGAYYVWAAGSRDRIEKRTVTVGEMDELYYRYQILDGLTLDDRIAFPAGDIAEGAPVTDEYVESDDLYGDGEVYYGDGEVYDNYDNNGVDSDDDYGIDDGALIFDEDDFVEGDTYEVADGEVEIVPETYEEVSAAVEPAEGGAD